MKIVRRCIFPKKSHHGGTALQHQYAVEEPFTKMAGKQTGFQQEEIGSMCRHRIPYALNKPEEEGVSIIRINL